MDTRLEERLNSLADQIERLRLVEAKFLLLDAHRKPMYSQLYLKADGKNVAEKEANAYHSKDWRDFVAGLVNAESDYNNERRRYELQLKAYDAEHLTLKTEAPVIKRQA